MQPLNDIVMVVVTFSEEGVKERHIRVPMVFIMLYYFSKRKKIR